jgi:hypothetical protein
MLFLSHLLRTVVKKKEETDERYHGKDVGIQDGEA